MRRKVPSGDDDLLYCGDVEWIPGDDGDHFQDEVYYVTEDYYKQGKVKRGSSKETGRWVCIVKHPWRYCRYCAKMGEHLSKNCPIKIERGLWYRGREYSEIICGLCLEEGHTIPSCPYPEYVPMGAKVVSDRALVLCRSCAAFDDPFDAKCECKTPDGEHVRIACLKNCWGCNQTDHMEDKCPVLLQKWAERENRSKERVQASMVKNCPTEKENYPTENDQASSTENSA